MNHELVIAVFIIHLFSVLYMTGLIWFVQVVHYPLKSSIGPSEFTAYQQKHMLRTGWVVGPPMLMEAGTALLLALFPPDPIGSTLPWVGLTLLVLIWLTTAFMSVPAHNRLLNGYDRKAHARLVNTNWIRTLLWTARSLLFLYALACLLNAVWPPSI